MSRDGWLAAWPADWRLTMDAVYDEVEAGLPRLPVETAAKLGRQDVQQSSFHGLHTTVHTLLNFSTTSICDDRNWRAVQAAAKEITVGLPFTYNQSCTRVKFL